MITKLVLKDVHSYVGLKEICFEKNSRCTAIIGNNGTGKSTILSALAFVGGILDSGWIEATSFVEVVTSRNVVYRRTGGDEYHINGISCGHEQYESAMSSEASVHFIEFETDWRKIIGDPVQFYAYMMRLKNRGRANRIDWDAEAYAEAGRQEQQLAMEVQHHLNKYKRAMKELNVLQKARRASSERETALRVSCEYKARVDTLKAAIAKSKCEASRVLINKLTVKLNESRSDLVKSEKIVRKASVELQAVEEQLRSLSVQKRKVDEELETKKADLCRLNLEQRLLSETYKTIDNMVLQSSQNLLDRMVSDIQLHLGALQIETPGTVSEVVELKVYLRSQQMAALQCFRLEIDAMVADINAKLSTCVANLENIMASLRSVRDSLQACDSEEADMYLWHRDALVDLQRQHVANYVTAIERVPDGLDSPFSPIRGSVENETIAAIKLAYPRVLGELHEFIKPLGNTLVSPHQALLILHRVRKIETGLVLVVDSLSTALTYAQRLPQFRSHSVLFLPRDPPEGYANKRDCTDEVLNHFPDLISLRSLFEPSEGFGVHLVDYATQDIFIAETQEVAEAVYRVFPELRALCDREGVPLQSTHSPGLYTVEQSENAQGSEPRDPARMRKSVDKALRRITSVKSQLQIEETELLGLLHETQGTIEYLRKRRSIGTRTCNQACLEIENLRAQSRLFTMELQRLRREPPLKAHGEHAAKVAKAYQEQLESSGRILRHALSKVQKHYERGTSDPAIKPESELMISGLAAEVEDLNKAKIQVSHALTDLQMVANWYEDYLEDNISKPTMLTSACEEVDCELQLLQEAHETFVTEIQNTDASLQSALAILEPSVANRILSEACEHASIMLDKIPADDRELELQVEKLEKDAARYSQLAEASSINTEVRLEWDVVSQKAQDTAAALEESKDRHALATVRLHELADMRLGSMEDALGRIRPHLQTVYKRFFPQALREAAQIDLKLVDELGTDQGISLYAMPANKTFTPASKLSSGEFVTAFLAFQIAACMAFEYDLILIDEIDTGLDCTAIEHIAQCLQHLLHLRDDSCKLYIATNEPELYNLGDQFVGLLKLDGQTSAFVVQ